MWILHFFETINQLVENKIEVKPVPQIASCTFSILIGDVDIDDFQVSPHLTPTSAQSHAGVHLKTKVSSALQYIHGKLFHRKISLEYQEGMCLFCFISYQLPGAAGVSL